MADALKFDRAVIATGARAAEPPISGLRDAGYLYQRDDIHLDGIAAPLGGDRRRADRLRAGAVLSALGQRGDIDH